MHALTDVASRPCSCDPARYVVDELPHLPSLAQPPPAAPGRKSCPTENYFAGPEQERHRAEQERRCAHATFVRLHCHDHDGATRLK